MKINSFSKIYNLTNSNIRYYIKIGLLIPSKKNSQYIFDEKNIKEMNIIIELKKLKFTLEEIQNFMAIVRFYDEHDNKVYIQLLDFYKEKKSRLIEERKQINNCIKILDDKIEQCRKTENINAEMTGAPVKFIEYLTCPNCSSTLNLDDANIRNNQIYKGMLYCNCGYKAEIDEGILLVNNNQEDYSKLDFLNKYFDKPENFEDIDLFPSPRNISKELQNYVYQSYNWSMNNIKRAGNEKPVILFPGLSGYFLYQNINNAYFKNALIIVTGFSKYMLKPLKKHIESLSLPLNILYVANTLYNIPIQEKSVDILIDSFASYEFSFFHKYSLLSKLNKYVKNNAVILGTTLSMKPNSKTLSNIKSLFPACMPQLYILSSFKSDLLSNNILVQEEKTLGETKNPGEYFNYHHKDDYLNIYTFFGIKKL